MTTAGDYSQDWREFRRVRNAGLIVWFASVLWVLAWMAVMLLLRPVLQGHIALCYAVLIPVTVVLAAANFFLGWRCVFLPCPRCRRKFFGGWWRYNTFARKFQYCGLVRFAEHG